MSTHHIAVIAGSLRKESFTLKIAKALTKLAPDTLKLEVMSAPASALEPAGDRQGRPV